jgi:hypothetical protein
MAVGTEQRDVGPARVRAAFAGLTLVTANVTIAG